MNKIVRLGCVPEDPQRNSADVTGVAAKQGRQHFPAPKANFADQGLVRKTGFPVLRLDCSRLLVGDPKFRQANCDRTVHDKEQCSEAAPLTTSVLMTSLRSPGPNRGIFSSALIKDRTDLAVRTPLNTLKRFSFSDLRIPLASERTQSYLSESQMQNSASLLATVHSFEN